jgi:ferredoxin-NADP reductase
MNDLPANMRDRIRTAFENLRGILDDCDKLLSRSRIFVDRLEGDLTEVDAYLCGPPPMVDAAIALLDAKGVPESHVYFDKFTTTEHQ